MVRIEEYEFGRIVVNGYEYREDIIIHDGGVEAGWWRKEGHKVSVEDLERILELNPELIIFGTGANGRLRVERHVKDLLKERGIEFMELNSYDAVKVYEGLSQKRKGVVLAIHLTC